MTMMTSKNVSRSSTATPTPTAKKSLNTKKPSLGSARTTMTSSSGAQPYSSLPKPVKGGAASSLSTVIGGQQSAFKTPTASARKPVKPSAAAPRGEHEALKAFLRIRPSPPSSSEESKKQEPYIEVVNDTEVLMNPPKDSTSALRSRVYATSIPTKYTFSQIFPGEDQAKNAAQETFFQQTTLPLVEELVQGQSGLIFTYGVTNSGKSYTVQGGQGKSEAGILPRSMDVLFNSIQGLHSSSNIRPVGLSGVERVPDVSTGGSNVTDKDADASWNPFSLPGMSKRFAANQAGQNPLKQYEHDTTTKVRIDRNYRYSIWVSYVEVYNEKIFDLLDAAPSSSASSGTFSATGGMTSSPSTTFSLARSDSIRGASNWALAASAVTSSRISSSSNAAAYTGASSDGPIYVQRKPLSLKNDVEAGGKYVSGVREIRVRSSAEARELMQRGQDNRRVFSTLANRASSRSHGVFTIKLIREHGGEGAEDGEDSLTCLTSRLSIVDLAGSERLSNTSASGDRLKEAGSINKSLMCLGQCIETLRKNQARAASFIPAPIQPISSGSQTGNTSSASSSSGTSSIVPRVLKRRPSIVPFRHSKLTELFQSFFTGEGRAVMIVNVNPYDTGFDENSHVMRFSAAAKEIHTVRTQAQPTNLSRFVHPSLRNLFNGRQSTTSPPKTLSTDMGGATPSCPPTPKASAMQAPPTPTPKRMAMAMATPASPQTAAKHLSKAPFTSVEATPKAPSATHRDRSVQAVKGARLSDDEGSREVTIIEVSDDELDEEDGGSENDPFVEHLMQQYEQMREALFESQMRCAAIEREVREEMAEEMAEQLQAMQTLYNDRMLADAQQNEEFVNRKLDLLARASGYQASASIAGHSEEDESFEDDEEEFTADFDDAREVNEDEHDEEEGEEEEDDFEVERTLAVEAQVSNNRKEQDSSLSNASTYVEEDDSIEFKPVRRSTAVIGAGRRIVSDDEEDDEPKSFLDDEDEQTQDFSSVLESGADDTNIIEDETSESMDVPAKMLRGQDRQPDSSVDEAEDEEEEEEDDESMSSTDDQTSDESFDITEESVESSFDAAPRARPSRTRQSAAVTKKTIARAASSTVASAAAQRKSNTVRGAADSPSRRRTTTATRTPKTRKTATTTAKSIAATVRKSSARVPLGESSSAANTSQECNSDASLILVSQSKTPKRKLFGRKTLMDEETMIEQLGDSSLLEELHRRTS